MKTEIERAQKALDRLALSLTDRRGFKWRFAERRAYEQASAALKRALKRAK